MPRTILESALRYATRGWAVFPLHGKRPYPGTQGHLDATIDERTIRRWWKSWPGANVGIRCDSQRGPIVLDVDGQTGADLVERLMLPDTRKAISRPGRWHLYYDPLLDGTPVPRTIKVKFAGMKTSLDILGDGGYVVAPPSIHAETGEPYEWAKRSRVVPLPSSILQLVQSTRSDEHRPAEPLPLIIREGERDSLLTSLAGSMRRRGASRDAILAALREENATRVIPPLEDRELRKIAKSIASKEPAGYREHYTDLGNARRFVAQHSELVRSIYAKRRPWHLYDGVRWVPDATGEIERMAKVTVRGLYTEASHLADPDERDRLLTHASKSEMAGKLRALLELAATEPELLLTPEQLDADPWLFNVENGTLNLKTGKLQPHDRRDHITRLAPVEFVPGATAPRWETFLSEIMSGDKAVIKFLQRAIGYALTGDVREECLFFCYGQGANGKSTLLEIVRALVGDYGQTADFNTFLTRRGEGPRNDLARLQGARFVAASEASGERDFDSTVIKQLTGADTVSARKLYEEAVEFRPQHKLFLAANHKPIVKEQTVAFWRRLRLIPFTVTIPPGKRDKQLRDTIIRDELSGVLNWALKGCLAWQRDGLGEPSVIESATRSYQEENDVLSDFLNETCDTSGGWVQATELYRAFTEWWLTTRGPRSQPYSSQWFARLMSERAAFKSKKRGGKRGWRGLHLLLEMAHDHR